MQGSSAHGPDLADKEFYPARDLLNLKSGLQSHISISIHLVHFSLYPLVASFIGNLNPPQNKSTSFFFVFTTNSAKKSLDFLRRFFLFFIFPNISAEKCLKLGFKDRGGPLEPCRVWMWPAKAKILPTRALVLVVCRTFATKELDSCLICVGTKPSTIAQTCWHSRLQLPFNTS